MTLDDFIRRALKVPFLEQGRDYDGWDCWGLVYCAYRDVMGVELPSYTENYHRLDVLGSPSLAKLIQSQLPYWETVTSPEKMDVAIFRLAGRPVHIGLMVDKNRALHTEVRRGSFVEPIYNVMWRGRLEGLYRHVG